MFKMVGNIFNKSVFWTRKHSPELLVAGAIITMAGGVISAAIATTKLDKTLKPFNARIDKIKKSLKESTAQKNELAIRNEKRELTKTYFKAGLSVTKLYLPTLLCVGASATCILGSHKIMKGRNLALAAAYTTLDNGFKAYRQRVEEKYGAEAEEKIFKDMHKEKVEVIDPVTGKKKIVTKEVPHVQKDANYYVLYALGNAGWTPDATTNYKFLISTQAWLNERFRRQGYLFLSDVYEALGFSTAYLGERRAQASRVLGWIYDPKDDSRDNYVSFGITQPGTDVALPVVAKQIDENEPNFFLNFNVDGDILTGNNGKKTFMKYARDRGY